MKMTDLLVGIYNTTAYLSTPVLTRIPSTALPNPSQSTPYQMLYREADTGA